MRIEERSYAETARDYALRILKNNIITMDLEPGAMVSENELAAQMGLSRTPVREALMDLAKCRVVDVLPQRGSRIALIDYSLVEEARFAREVLEVAIMDLVCAQITQADITQLRQNVRLQTLTQEPGVGDSLSL
ncbi:MAG: GntR family transcriptional regulator, partial [Clostridia bacterium]|nr:GntR family transcriptional regulator [Clostridia bacterium]